MSFKTSASDVVRDFHEGCRQDRITVMLEQLTKLHNEVTRACMISPVDRHEVVSITISRGDFIPVTLKRSSLSEAARGLVMVVTESHGQKIRELVADLSDELNK